MRVFAPVIAPLAALALAPAAACASAGDGAATAAYI